jgi:hypothetical protein
VPDRVRVVWANPFKKPLEVIYRYSFPMPDAVRGSGGAPDTRAARFLAMVITMAAVAVPQGRCLRCLLPFLISHRVQQTASLGGASLSVLGVASLLACAWRCMTAL